MRGSRSQIDGKGFRANVAIVLFNDSHRLFWAKRVGMDAWQFPQGGVRPNEVRRERHVPGVARGSRLVA